MGEACSMHGKVDKWVQNFGRKREKCVAWEKNTVLFKKCAKIVDAVFILMQKESVLNVI